ncbi:MAG: YeeE/YedE family protein [Gammaproteobacteria bacterium]|nr:MAG: YeeE/YedE family protein [Gammaproteobacteria bacterium]
MEFTIHNQVLLTVFLTAAVMGAVVNKTNFCTMGAVSDWVNMEDLGRMRAWILAIAVAMLGVVILEASGTITLPNDTFPPYRTANFAWLRYVLGGVMFGIGMTLGSGCGNKTLIRVGSGNLKSVFVLIVTAFMAYLMLWGEDPFAPGEGIFTNYFSPWIDPTTIDLSSRGFNSQELGALVGGVMGQEDTSGYHTGIGLLVGLGLLFFVFKSSEFRSSFEKILGGVVVGAAVLIGWYITGGSIGVEWKDYADFAPEIPSRVAVQSYTFISPMGDSFRYALQPDKLSFVNFGVMALVGVIAGSLIYSLFSRTFRIEWFANKSDVINHAAGGVLMGVGGVLSMGCTVGQGITGVSTLALGSFLAFVSIVFGSALTMKVQFAMMDDIGFFAALRNSLAEMKLMPTAK